jgi:hypothetical protein
MPLTREQREHIMLKKPFLSACAFAMLMGGMVATTYAQGAIRAGEESGSPAEDLLQDDACGIQVVRNLAGIWRAETYTLPRSGASDAAVFGEGAYDLRDVELTIEATGQATLRVSSAVVGRKGVKYAPSITEVKLAIAPPAVSGEATWIQPPVTVLSADKRYLDEFGGQGSVEGMQVRLTTDLSSRELDLHVVAPGGDSFGTKLTVRKNAKSGTRAPIVAAACQGTHSRKGGSGTPN